MQGVTHLQGDNSGQQGRVEGLNAWEGVHQGCAPEGEVSSRGGESRHLKTRNNTGGLAREAFIDIKMREVWNLEQSEYKSSQHKHLGAEFRESAEGERRRRRFSQRGTSRGKGGRRECKRTETQMELRC